MSSKDNRLTILAEELLNELMVDMMFRDFGHYNEGKIINIIVKYFKAVIYKKFKENS